MTKGRPYISCPLEAALAAKNFGMEFYRISKNGIEVELDLYDCSIDIAGYMSIDLGRLYLKPDSLPLLWPKVGDLVMSASGTTAGYILENCDGMPRMDNIICVEEMLLNDDEIIIQRNGKPFPKIEWEA